MVTIRNEIIENIRSPFEIQRFLDSIRYNCTERTLSPFLVVKERMAHCMDGGLFAAAALRHLGFKPLIVDMVADNDDDHIIAVFQEGKRWGAVAKSNTTVLRYREPVYHSLRELVMSYFEFYYNLNGEKTLRSYSLPVDLSRFDEQNWETTYQDLGFIGDFLGEVKHHPIITKKQVIRLNSVPDYVFNAGFMGADMDGLYKPK